MMTFSRRGFLAASAAASASLMLPARVRAQSPALTLSATTRTIEVQGRAATIMGLVNARGGNGLTLDPGQRMQVDLTNALDRDTIIHWHGQIPPNSQDGVPNTNPMLTPGETRSYDFATRPGTFWMHSHIPVQEVGLLAAPLIVRSEADLAADRQEVVLFLHDFSFKTPEEVLTETIGGEEHAAMSGGGDAMAGMDHGAMAGAGGMQPMGGMGAMAMDLNDFDFDAYLANDRTLDDPEVVTVERNGRVLLRAINGSAMTAYLIDLGGQRGRLVAVDGDPCQPLAGTRFGFAPGQRLDIEIDMPADGSALPVLALREGARERTGIILAPPGASVPRIPGMSETEHPAFSADLSQEAALRAATPLPERRADRLHQVMLGGSMSPYVWTIDGRVWGDQLPIQVRSGERVEMTLHNMSMMAHPMHLHGHVFQVVGLGMERIAGALRDTVHVPSMSMVTIAFDAGEVAPWMLHCHHMGHLETGMMTELDVTA
ncbi:multicopper oxidase family protein [Paracoccus marinaquae]|uniref:Multicopper oxidase domain-containing protein n=1 Tax=Paracoccus marinaquae TaxID=2841926 RepID=A0ABS6AEL0_9RHOB|nr:multicopper oxidase domain-containing protein [Paracoccus marinaquae]MBU3029048.1 multicopper oxidase domain-containing protein [Paracoccus marinaquae]